MKLDRIIHNTIRDVLRESIGEVTVLEATLTTTVVLQAGEEFMKAITDIRDVTITPKGSPVKVSVDNVLVEPYIDEEYGKVEGFDEYDITAKLTIESVGVKVDRMEGVAEKEFLKWVHRTVGEEPRGGATWDEESLSYRNVTD